MSVELKGISKQVGVETHIYPTDLRLEAGGFNVLLGTTLAGKTSLLRLMAGLEHPTAGELWFAGQNVTGIAVQRRSVAMVYQQFVNYPNFNVFENIASPLRVAAHSHQAIVQRVEQIAELLKLSPLLGRYPHELSGGQQQRTALARALVKDAALVLLDEPLANLDYKLREELRAELPKLFTNTGATVVYATSEPTEALLLAGHTAALHQGQVVQYGITHQVYRQPDNLLSAQVFSDPPMNTAVLQRSAARVYLTDDVEWALPAKLVNTNVAQLTLGIRPHHLSLNPVGETAVKVSGQVTIAEISGSESIIHARVAGHDWVAQSQGVHTFEVGDMIHFYFDLERCYYFADGQNLLAD